MVKSAQLHDETYELARSATRALSNNSSPLLALACCYLLANTLETVC